MRYSFIIALELYRYMKTTKKGNFIYSLIETTYNLVRQIYLLMRNDVIFFVTSFFITSESFLLVCIHVPT